MKPAVHLIVAVDRRGAIGRAGDLLYRIRQDLRRFKALTTGNTIVMGRRTWESLPGALPGRRNIVVTTDSTYHAEGAETAASAEEALRKAAEGPGDTFIIGGGRLYAALADAADVLHLTVVADTAEAPDTFLPPLPLERFRTVTVEPFGSEPPAALHTLIRI